MTTEIIQTKRETVHEAFSPEAKAEILCLTDLALNIGDAMKVLYVRNITKPLNTYADKVEPIPEFLIHAESYAEKFIIWQLQRKDINNVWSHPDAFDDSHLYIRRRIWDIKTERDLIIRPEARILALQIKIQRTFRSDVHEALNHAIKHNEDVAKLKGEIEESVDEVVRENLRKTTEKLAHQILISLPQLQATLLEKFES